MRVGIMFFSFIFYIVYPLEVALIKEVNCFAHLPSEFEKFTQRSFFQADLPCPDTLVGMKTQLKSEVSDKFSEFW